MTLDETYERILLGIDREKREHAIRLLQCLTVARRPLHVKELAEILAIQFDADEIPQLNVDWRPGNANDAVLSACSALVTTVECRDNRNECCDGYGHNYYTYSNDDISDGSRIVHFSHYSVKEFLTSERLTKSEKGELSQY